MNQREEQRLAALVEEEQSTIAQSLLRLDQLLEEIASVRADIDRAIERVKALAAVRG